MEQRRDLLLRFFSADQRTAVGTVDIFMYPYPTGFLFSSNIENHVDGTQRKWVEISIESMVTVLKIATASAVSRKVGGDEWLRDYLLYMRSVPGGALLVDPLRASGIVTASGKLHNSLTQSTMVALMREAYDIADSMWMFLLGHELAHQLQPYPTRLSQESDDAFRLRTRSAEAAADIFSLKVLAAASNSYTSTGERRPFYLKGAPVLFLAWVLSMEGVAGPINSGSHPPDHLRAQDSSAWIVSHVPDLQLSPSDQASLLAAAQSLSTAMQTIADDPNFFEELDAMAKTVTLSGLRRLP